MLIHISVTNDPEILSITSEGGAREKQKSRLGRNEISPQASSNTVKVFLKKSLTLQVIYIFQIYRPFSKNWKHYKTQFPCLQIRYKREVNYIFQLITFMFLFCIKGISFLPKATTGRLEMTTTLILAESPVPTALTYQWWYQRGFITKIIPGMKILPLRFSPSKKYRTQRKYWSPLKGEHS